MFRHILVGVHGHLGGRDAIALAARLGTQGAELTLAHVYPGDSRIWPASDAEYDAIHRERARSLLAAACEQAAVHAGLQYKESPSVGRGLHELAVATGADLLVVGSSARGLLGRVLLGDDAHATLGGAPCAVAIAPSGYSEESVGIHEIGVAYNGSPESEHALAVGRALAAEHGARLSAFEAVTLPAYAFMAGPAPLGEAVEDFVEDARERIAMLGDVEAHASYGHAGEELALYSASLDVLIIGSRDYGPMGRLVHGSTAMELARGARCPLLVLTRAARASSRPNSELGAPAATA